MDFVVVIDYIKCGLLAKDSKPALSNNTAATEPLKYGQSRLRYAVSTNSTLEIENLI